MSKKSNANSDVIDAINEKLGKNTAASLKDSTFRADSKDFIPFGIDVVDKYLLSSGGLPCGRFVEIYGDEGAGKSTMTLHAIRACQKMGGTAALLHTEEAYTKSRLQALGVGSDLILAEPDTMEGVLQGMEAILDALKSRKKKGASLVVWDSLAATKTEAEASGGVAPKKGFDVRAKLLSAALRILPRMAAEANACILIVNQNRQKIGVLFGNPTTQPGGNAPKFTSSVRIELFPGAQILKDGVPVGKNVTVKIWKNKHGPPLRKAWVPLYFATGFDNSQSVVELAKEFGLVKKRSQSVEIAREALEACGWDPTGVPASVESEPGEFDDGEPPHDPVTGEVSGDE